jgi:DNA repair protein RadC
MKHSIKTVTWKFCDAVIPYPAVQGAGDIYVHSPEQLFKHFLFLFQEQVHERFVVFWLSASNRVTGFEIVSEGILNSSLVHPREVFRGAIVATCASIIVAHNHPSGNPEPSANDLEITVQLVEAGKLIGIRVHDHVLFTDSTYTSLAERGLM